MEGSAVVRFFDRSTPSDEETALTVRDVCQRLGFHTSDDTPVSGDGPRFDEQGEIQLYWENSGRARFTFGPAGLEGEDVANYLGILTRAALINPNTESGDYTGFPGVFVDLIRQLSLELDPVYVSTYSSLMARDGLLPEVFFPIPELTDIERLPWLGVYADPLIEQFGGRERVRQTPAWRVEELDTGSIMIIQTRIPWGEQWEKYHNRQPADRYLLDGMERTDAISPSSGVTLSDPFGSLDPGDIGTDICVHRDDIREEFRNEDLQLVPVRVDIHRNLRRLDTGEFVRNVVTDTTGDQTDIIQRMLADIPATADDDVYVSALLRDLIPPEFVRLDDRADDNVASKVMAIETNVNKIELLVSLGRVAQQDEFTTEDLQTMVDALDTLVESEDVDGVDQYIEQNLL